MPRLGLPGSPDETPVLTVSIPRSGSTLLAQTFAVHPEVSSARESASLALVRKGLGLGWDPACLSFQNSDTQVKTLSNWQAGQPIFSTSVQPCRRHEKH